VTTKGQDLFPPAIVDIGGSHIVQSLMETVAVVVVNEALHGFPQGLGTPINEQVHLNSLEVECSDST
jgi:hypothetical protein